MIAMGLIVVKIPSAVGKHTKRLTLFDNILIVKNDRQPYEG